MKTDAIKRVNITLPLRTLRKIEKTSTPGGRSQFIDKAVNFYIKEVGRKELREALKEGAQVWADRDRTMAKEWSGIEEEVWQKYLA